VKSVTISYRRILLNVMLTHVCVSFRKVFAIFVYIAEKIYGENRQQTSSRKDINFYVVPAHEIKTGLSVEKVNALNFSSTALFTRGVNRMKFINFHASIILELNLAAAAEQFRRRLNFSSALCETLPFPSELIVWGLTSRSSLSRDKSLPLTQLEI